ncbi:hypothetical protein PVAP13_9NG390400 [Panicum virgatum]|uniref:BTB domain-containing protein n=1 Tax=Panicum virgatum TaxID=38727 RepID=A0A8T0MPJ4_PANVG|nr:hypothetical protein PVAP13_9NG390400 [Panicum virgatum]
MPPSESAAGGHGGTLSASAIVGGTVTGHHLLQIDCYSRSKEELPSGEYINYYPNGDTSEAAEFISIYLNLDHSVAEPVKARARLSLLDQAGTPVLSHSLTTKIRDFCKALGGFGCDVIVTKELCAEERRPQFPLVVVPPSNLHQNLGDLLASKEGADVTFLVAGETFKAHKCVLAARSAVFKAESTNGALIRVDDMDAHVFMALLNFVYTDALPDFQDMKKQEEAAMAQHLLVAADRYNLERLKLICEDRLCGHIDTASAATILVLAEQHHCSGLKEACFRFLSSVSTLNAVMATDGFDHLTRSCPSVLKELMSNIAARAPC